MGMCLLMVCGWCSRRGLVPEDVNSGTASHRGGVTFSRGRHGNDGGPGSASSMVRCWFGSIFGGSRVAVEWQQWH